MYIIRIQTVAYSGGLEKRNWNDNGCICPTHRGTYFEN